MSKKTYFKQSILKMYLAYIHFLPAFVTGKRQKELEEGGTV